MTNSFENDSLLLTNARIVLASRILERASLRVAEGRIAALDEGGAMGAGPSIDLQGAVLFPGFIDLHIHGADGVDVMEARVPELAQVASFLASHGVTAWLPTLVPSSAESYAAAVNAADNLIVQQREFTDVIGSRVLGVHYEGPFVNSSQCGALHLEHFRTFTDELTVDDLPVVQASAARMMMTFAPEVEGGIELARLLNSRWWVLSIGHTRAGIEVLDKAFEAGAKHMTHFMNAMAPLHHRNPGPVAWGLMNDQVSCDIIADGHHLDRYMLRLLLRLKGSASLCLISDAIAAAGKGDGNYEIWGETITVTNGLTSNAKGSIAGSVITMLDAVRMMRSLGVNDVEIARMASLNPARLLRLEDEIGSIEVGKRADLVALDENGKVRLTIIGGRVAFEV